MQDEITLFAETNFRDKRVKFGIKTADRRKHFYIIGKTGMGKTTLLENMAIQDIQTGRGIGIVDPHGDFAEKMLDFVPSNRINDVIYFNPADLDYPIAFNVIEKVDPEHRHLIASGIIGVFKKLWVDSWGPRLEYVLRNCILALLEYPGSTLLGIMRMLIDKKYRNKVIEKITDPVVKSFWVDEFSKYPDRFMAEAIAPIQNKVGQFLTSPLIRNIVGQTKSAINIREVMDSGKILIMNLSKGRLGEDNSSLLGAMLITKIQVAAMSRVDMPEAERRDFYLYVDEFQNFATESFANILSEARKYRLNLILAHQYIAQMVEPVRDAVFGNVGTMVVFRVGAADAEFLEKEFSPEFSVSDLVSLGFKNIYLKLMIDGLASRPFSAETLPPIQAPEISHREKIIRISRERYSCDRKLVEEKIARWSGVIESEQKEKLKTKTSPGDAKPNFSPAANKKPAAPTFKTNCWQCGKEISLTFKPDGARPVYCKACLAQGRQTQGAPSPKNQKITSEVLVKETGQPISLGEAIKKEPAKFASKKKKEVDLTQLRKTLAEVLGPEAIKKSDSLAAAAQAAENDFEESAPPEKTEDNLKQGELEEGKEVEL